MIEIIDKLIPRFSTPKGGYKNQGIESRFYIPTPFRGTTGAFQWPDEKAKEESKYLGQRTNCTTAPTGGYFAIIINWLAFMVGLGAFQVAFDVYGSGCCYQTVAQGWEN